MIEMKHTAADQDAMLLDLRQALRKVPPATWRDLAKRKLPGDDLAEKLLQHLLLCGWEFGHRPPEVGHSTP